MSAAEHFTAIWGIHMNKSTARKPVRILEKLKEAYSVRGKVYSRGGVDI